MSLEDQLFTFEAKLHWVAGTELNLLRDAVERWHAGAPDVIHGETAFEIVYQMPDERFIRVYAPGCKPLRERKGLFGTREIWETKDLIEIGYLSGWPLILFFRDNNQSLPETLAKMIDEAKAASERVRPLDELLRIEFPPGPPGSTAHRVDWRWLINQLQKLLVDVVNELRTGTNKYYSSESIHWLCRLLSQQYEVDVAHWWGPKGTIPSATVDILELPWPNEYAGVVLALAAFRDRAWKLLRICDRRLQAPGAPATDPNDAERQFVWNHLIGMLPELEGIVSRFLKAIPLETAAIEPQAAQTDHIPIFIEQGSTWLVSFRGKAGSFPEEAGFWYLRELTSKPDQQIPVGKLVELRSPRSIPQNESHQPISDEAAVREYRQRLDNLTEEISEALALGSREKVASLKAEQILLIEEHNRTTDNMGKSRPMKNQSESHRASVTRDVRKATKNIGQKLPALRRHLEVTIKTGKLCTYNPAKDVTTYE